MKADAKADAGGAAQEAVTVHHVLLWPVQIKRHDVAGNFGAEGDLAGLQQKFAGGHGGAVDA